MSKLSPAVKTILKLLLTSLALGWLAYQMDWERIWPLLRRAQWGWILVALVLYNISQLLSTSRFQQHLKAVPLAEPFSFLLRLYYRSMFFNLFLPGGIGGDGYKAWLLRTRHQTDYRLILSVLLLDRGSGMLAITFMIALLGGSSTWLTSQFGLPYGWLSGLALLVGAGGWGVYRLFFRKFVPVFPAAFSLSLGVQSTQVIVILLLLRSIGVTDHSLEYGLVFLVSSIASVLPLTVGGIGVREFVFLTAAEYLPIQSDQAVLASLLFFFINALSSSLGAFITLPERPETRD
ncbi:lysylphosphatidylglycerol synthase transmembrane domain-containing protein [Siphonobacter sp.]|uniref:lysylphosphatidylglycerol synthase transmembrane domain-containing protein n=1 Tax=Siphonobacter sp. TaxID=1869184 RepID=UPI003B3B62F5